MRFRNLFLLLALVATMASCSSDGSSADKSSSETKGDAAADGDSEAPLATPGDGEWHAYHTGKLDGKIEIILDLYGQDGAVRGTITYKKSGKPITVVGTLRKDDLWLKELQADGLVTGTISGKIDRDRISGNWYGDKEAEYKLETSASSPPEGGQEWPYDAPSTVAGTYEYHYPPVENGDPGAEGVLTVKQTGDKIIYSFDCVSSPPAYNMAMIEETESDLDGNVAHYHETEYGDCEFVIRFFKGFAIVEQQNGHYDCGFGMAASVEGEYIKIK